MLKICNVAKRIPSVARATPWIFGRRFTEWVGLQKRLSFLRQWINHWLRRFSDHLSILMDGRDLSMLSKLDFATLLISQAYVYTYPNAYFFLKNLSVTPLHHCCCFAFTIIRITEDAPPWHPSLESLSWGKLWRGWGGLIARKTKRFRQWLGFQGEWPRHHKYAHN